MTITNIPAPTFMKWQRGFFGSTHRLILREGSPSISTFDEEIGIETNFLEARTIS
jgi:hypothetical protein